MTPQRWYEHHAWIVFAIIGLMGLVIALPVLADPAAGAGAFEPRRRGPPCRDRRRPRRPRLRRVRLPLHLRGDVRPRPHDRLIAAFAFRHGARWAWIAFCFWPALFLSNLLTYEAAARPAQLAMLTLTTAALAASYRKTWRHTPETGQVGTAA